MTTNDSSKTTPEKPTSEGNRAFDYVLFVAFMSLALTIVIASGGRSPF